MCLGLGFGKEALGDWGGGKAWEFLSGQEKEPGLCAFQHWGACWAPGNRVWVMCPRTEHRVGKAEALGRGLLGSAALGSGERLVVGSRLQEGSREEPGRPSVRVGTCVCGLLPCCREWFVLTGVRVTVWCWRADLRRHGPDRSREVLNAAVRTREAIRGF